VGDALNRSTARVIGVVQARMSSTRLPGKVLTKLGEGTVLELLLRRLQAARELDEVVIATSDNGTDDPIVKAAGELGVSVFRGPLSDVLERFRLAAAATGADAVVRITADCPLLDPAVVDGVVARWRETRADYAANTLCPRSYPDGMDVEVISATALASVAARAADPADREHVTSYVRERPEEFAAVGLWLTPSHGSARITLDTPEDLKVLRGLVAAVGPDAPLGCILEALGLPAATVVRTST
jgi:spore coat polysaccharide biosynthesis protein SpsF